jgi:hypothetical protein
LLLFSVRSKILADESGGTRKRSLELVSGSMMGEEASLPDAQDFLQKQPQTEKR